MVLISCCLFGESFSPAESLHDVSLSDSLQVAKRYVETALDYSKDIAIGNGLQGPFDHLLKLKSDVRNSCRPRPFDPDDLFLYAVTDSGMNKKWGRSIRDAVKAAIEGGATIIQLRLQLLKCICYYFLFFESCGSLHVMICRQNKRSKNTLRLCQILLTLSFPFLSPNP